MSDLNEDIKPELIWNRIHAAGKLLDLDAPEICERAGLSKNRQEELKAGTFVPSLSKLTLLSEKTGLPVEFFVSKSEPAVFPARFRSGAGRGVEEAGELDQYWQRREILRLGGLADFLAHVLPESHAKAVIKLRRAVQGIRRDPARAILDGLAIGSSSGPLGIRIGMALDRAGVIRVLYPFYTRAKIAGVSWWQRGTLPFLSVAAGLSARRGYFTTAHELVHLLLHMEPDKTVGGYRCRLVPTLNDSNDPKEEREANRLAAELLMPDELRHEARDRIAESGVSRGIGELSDEWDLSRRTVALRLLNWEIVNRDGIRRFFVPRAGFAPAKPRPPEDRFGSPDRTRDFVRKIHEAGATARTIAWLTKIPLDNVFCLLGRIAPQEIAG